MVRGSTYYGIIPPVTPAPLPLPDDITAACAAAEDAFHRGHPESRALAEALLAAARACGDVPSEACAQHLLGGIDYDMLAYGPALEHLDEAIALRRRALGDADDATRLSLAIRALVLAGEDRPEDAARDLDAACVGRRAPESPADAAGQAKLWISLGAAYSALERGVEARSALEAVIAAAPAYPVPPMTLANACLHLATIFEQCKESNRATELHERAVAIRREVIGVPSLRVAMALTGLATSRLRARRLPEGRAMLVEAAGMLEACGQAAHPRSSVIYLGLAVVETLTGRGPAAEVWLTRMIDTETRTFGPLHPNTGAMLLTAAQTYAARGYHGRASELAQRATAAIVTRLPSHVDAFEKALGVGFLSLRHIKKHDTLVRWLEPLAARLERLDPPQEHALAPLLNMLGEGYRAAGKIGKAEAVLRRSLAMTERLHGEISHPVHVVLVNLAGLLEKQRRLDDARAVRERANRVKEELEAGVSGLFRPRWRRGSA